MVFLIIFFIFIFNLQATKENMADYYLSIAHSQIHCYNVEMWKKKFNSINLPPIWSEKREHSLLCCNKTTLKTNFSTGLLHLELAHSAPTALRSAENCVDCRIKINHHNAAVENWFLIEFNISISLSSRFLVEVDRVIEFIYFSPDYCWRISCCIFNGTKMAPIIFELMLIDRCIVHFKFIIIQQRKRSQSTKYPLLSEIKNLIKL